MRNPIEALAGMLAALKDENGRVVVDLQVPGVLAGLASSLPGIPSGYADRVREALRTGLRGPIVDIRDEDDSGLTITID